MKELGACPLDKPLNKSGPGSNLYACLIFFIMMLQMKMSYHKHSTLVGGGNEFKNESSFSPYFLRD